MGALQENRGVVFGINRIHNYWDIPTPTADVSASTAAVFSQPWNNIFTSHPALTGRSSSVAGGHLGGVELWINTGVPGGPSSVITGVINAFGFVNMSTGIDTTAANRERQLTIGIGTASNTGASVENLFAPSPSDFSRHPDVASAASLSWLLELTEEDTASIAPEQYYRFIFRVTNGTSHVNDLVWVRLGELFIGNIYHPPCPHSIRLKPSRAATLLRNADNTWTWNRRSRRSGRRITLGWRGLSDAERLELEQFVSNVGDPYHHAHRPSGLGFGVGPVTGLNDFASPVMLSLHREAFRTTTPSWRTAMYCVVDPASVDFAYSPAANEWDARASFIEVT
jgi:hypothetical protein